VNVQDIMTRVKRTFGDEAGVQITDADIFRWINDGQREIAVQNDALQTKGTLASVAGQQAYTLPADLLTLQSVWFAGFLVNPKSWQQAEEDIIALGTPNVLQQGQPSFYWTWANQINFYPVPSDSVSSIVVFYNRSPIQVATSLDSLDLGVTYHNAILQYVLQQAYELDEDWTASTTKQTQFENSLKDLSENETWNGRRSYPVITVLPEDQLIEGYYAG
jgi:hypothetical protein